MSEVPKPVPDNMTFVWHRGDFSIAEIYTRKIKDGFSDGVSYHRVRYERNEQHQLPEEIFKSVYLQAIALCGLHPELVVSVIRNDKESEVDESDNNRPFIMDSSPRYFPGAEVKDIIYEGTIYHSDPSVVKKYDMSKIPKPQSVVTSHGLTRKERKRLRHK